MNAWFCKEPCIFLVRMAAHVISCQPMGGIVPDRTVERNRDYGYAGEGGSLSGQVGEERGMEARNGNDLENLFEI